MMLGTGGGPAPGGTTGSSGGVFGSGGTSGMVGMGGTLGTGGAQGGTAGAQGGMSTGMGGTTMTGMDPESGRLVGITAAHNAVRAAGDDDAGAAAARVVGCGLRRMRSSGPTASR